MSRIEFNVGGGGEVLFESQQLAGLEPLGRARFAPLSRDEEKAKQTMAAVADFEMEGRAKRSALGIKCRFDEKALFPQGAPDKPAALVDALFVRPVQPATREILLQLVTATPHASRKRCA